MLARPEAPPVDAGWRARSRRSLPEVYGSIAVGGGWLRRLLSFSGPGYLVAVGYMDPGNWATDLAGGAQFGYALLSVILISNLMAILLQALCVRLGFVTRRDLAQACRDAFPRPVSFFLWVMGEIMIIACDLAEVIGAAIALKLLFGIPLTVGVFLTALDVLIILMLQQRGFRLLEAFIITLILTITVCFVLELAWSQPSLAGVAAGFVPSTRIVTDPAMLYIAIGILGATVMPHNLYLHSAIVQTRKVGDSAAEKRSAIRFATIDSTVALMGALFVNAAILILAASAFHFTGKTEVAEIEEAYQLLSPTLGAPLASTLFAVALLASGQNSTITGTLAGQIIMEGFLGLRLPAPLRRLITRGLALIPAVIGVWLYGDQGTTGLLVLSQVVLSLQLPFAVVPLVLFVTDRAKMGEFVVGRATALLAWGVALLIIGLNLKLLYDFFLG